MARFNFEAFVRAADANFDPVSGAKLYVYRAGTTTPVTTYTDLLQTTPHASPIVADSAGFFAAIYMPDGTYKVRVTDAADVLIYEQDNIPQGEGGSTEIGTVAELLATENLNALYAAGTVLTVGQFRYEVAASDATDNHITTTDGTGKLYALMDTEGRFTVKQFGATENTDITSELQACIDAALYNSDRTGQNMANVLIDVHEGTLSGSIWCSYGDVVKTIQVRGLGSTYGDNEDSFKGTVLTYTPTSGFAFAVQGGRRPTLAGFTIYGAGRSALQALDPVTLQSQDFLTPTNADLKTWDKALNGAGIAPNRRYAPYAAIAIDPLPDAAEVLAAQTITALTAASPAVATVASHSINSKAPETVTIAGLSSHGIDDGEYYAVRVNSTTFELHNLDWTATTGTSVYSGSSATLTYSSYTPGNYPGSDGSFVPATPTQRTSGFRVEDVMVQGFEVGIVVNPSQDNANGDFGDIDRFGARYVKFPVSYCQTNARANSISRPLVQVVYCQWENVHFGNANGQANVVVRDGEGGFMMMYALADMSKAASCSFEHCHYEGVAQIAKFVGSGSSNMPFLLENCAIKLNNEYYRPPSAIEVKDGATEEPVVRIVASNIVSYWPLTFNSEHVTLEDVTWETLRLETKEYAAQAFSNAPIVTAKSAQQIGTFYHDGYNLDTIATNGRMIGPQMTDIGKDFGIPWWCRRVQSTPGGSTKAGGVIEIGYIEATIGTGGIRTNEVISDLEITFNSTYNDNLAAQIGLRNGCVLVDNSNGTRMSIFSVDTGTNTYKARLDSNIWEDPSTGTITLADTDWDPTANTWRIFIAGLFSPEQPIVGDFVSGSTDIINVRTPSSDAATDFGLATGHWLWAPHYDDALFGNDDTSISAIDDSPSAVAITGVTSANPPVVTAASHGLTDGQIVTIASVTGTTQANGTWEADVIDGDTFSLRDTDRRENVDGSGFGAYVSGGTVTPTYGSITLATAPSATRRNVPLTHWIRTIANETSA